jgi:exonuclease VII large subunit
VLNICNLECTLIATRTTARLQTGEVVQILGESIHYLQNRTKYQLQLKSLSVATEGDVPIAIGIVSQLHLH